MLFTLTGKKPGSTFTTLFFVVVLLLILLNIFTPLRLNTDGVRYLNILEFLKGNLDGHSSAAHDFFPHGYPWFLYCLDKLHLLNPVSITLVNIISVLISAYLMALLLKIESKLLYIALVLLSFVNIKHFTLSVADQFFTLFFISSIYFWTKAFSEKLVFFIPALILTVSSIYLRTAGVSILLGVVLYGVYCKRDLLTERKRLLIVLLIACLGLMAIFLIKLQALEKRVDYIHQLDLELLLKNPLSIFSRLLLHVKEIGEITLNLPYDKLASLLIFSHFDLANICLYILGLSSFFVYYKSIRKLKLYRSFIFWVGVSYLVLIIIWPFYDTRFWIPIIPLLIILSLMPLFSKPQINIFTIAPLLFYIVFGFTSALYSDALSLNRSYFEKHYGFDPNLNSVYKKHFEDGRPVVQKRQVFNIRQENLSYLLEMYDRK